MDRAFEIFRHGLKRAAASFAAAAAIFTAGCTKQSLETTYSSQENRIDSFITSQLESNENYMLGAARSYLHYNNIDSMESFREKILEITREELTDVAREIYGQGISTLIYR